MISFLTCQDPFKISEHFFWSKYILKYLYRSARLKRLVAWPGSRLRARRSKSCKKYLQNLGLQGKKYRLISSESKNILILMILSLSEIILFSLFHFSYLDIWFIVGDRCQVIHCDHIRRPESANQNRSRLHMINNGRQKQMILSLPKNDRECFGDKSPQSLFIAKAGLIFLLLVGKEFKHWRNWISIL